MNIPAITFPTLERISLATPGFPSGPGPVDSGTAILAEDGGVLWDETGSPILEG